MTDPNNAAQTAEQDPLSDQFVNAVIRQHGYDSPEAVIARLWQWIGLNGSENGVTLLMYEAHKALSKLRAPVSDIREGFELTYAADADDPACASDLSHFTNGWRACIMSQVGAPVADERADFNAWLKTQRNPDDMNKAELVAAWEAWQERGRRAALASAPVAGEAQKPVGTLLNQHGEILWHRKPEYFPADFYAAPQASEAHGGDHFRDATKMVGASEAVRDVEDAARWRWATAVDDNAEMLHSIVLCHGGDQQKINERADFYRAALSAQPGAQKGEAHEA